jgi:RecA/RadA recombinase
MLKKILTGSGCLDINLEGGISPETVTLIYGEPETGKSTLAAQCAVNCALQGFKTLFVDCDGMFSAKRLSQLSAGKFDEVAELIILVKPTEFREQTALVDHLMDYTAKNTGLVVFDTVTSLYRANVAESSRKPFDLNRELNRQMALLAETAKIQKIPVIVTSQVHGVFDEPLGGVAPVATRVLKFWADTIIAMNPTENSHVIKAVLEKTSHRAEEAVCHLDIELSGIHDYLFH